MSHRHTPQEPFTMQDDADVPGREGPHEDPALITTGCTALEQSATETGYVHPDAARLFKACPWMEYIPLFGPSCRGVGPRCTISVTCCFFLNKGIGNYVVQYNAYAMFRTRFGIDGTRYQRLATLRSMGWSVKALTACISDTFALFGYTKRWYCAASCIAGAAFAVAFGVLPAKESSANIGAGFMFLTCFCMANVDILSDWHYSRLLRKHPEAGAPFVSWIWSALFVASVVAAAIQGPLADENVPQVAMFISAACQALAVVFFIFNWYGERLNRVERYEDFLVEAAERRRLAAAQEAAAAMRGSVEPVAGEVFDEAAQPPHEHKLQPQQQLKDLSDGVEVAHVSELPYEDDDDMETAAYITSVCCGAVQVNREVFFRNWRLYVYSAVMVASVITQALVTLFGTSRDLGLSSMAVAVVCCGMAFWACHIIAAKVIVFIFLDMLSFVSLPGVMDSFYMASPDCLPGGPNFSFTFYNTVTAIVSNFAAVGGALAFTYIFSQRSYWCTFVCVLLLKEVSSIFDIVIVKRWNLHIGIPDHAMYVLGDSVVFRICIEMSWMPVALLFSRICPRGSESVIYALASGFTNMGQAMASAMGSLLIELVWPVVTVGECDFSNVPMLLVIAHLVIPLAAFPLAFLLLPRARMCDPLHVDGAPPLAQEQRKEETSAEPSRSR